MAVRVLLTSSGAHSVHGGHGLPLIPLRVVALTGAQAIGPIESPNCIKQPVDHCNAHANTPCQHGGYQLPLIPFWIIPSEKEKHIDLLFVCFFVITFYFKIHFSNLL